MSEMRVFGFGPPDPTPPDRKDIRAWNANILFDAQLGASALLYKDAGCKEVYLAGLGRLIGRLRPGDVLFAIRPAHVARRVSDLRKVKRAVEARGATLTIFMACGQRNPSVAMCEQELRRAAIEASKAAGRYRAGPGRPSRVDPVIVGGLMDSGLSVEEIMARLICNRATVFRALDKLKRAKAA